MTSDHEEWLERAASAQRAKRYDEAREYAMRVVREDGRNAKALWIVATSTSSLSERRNALNMLLRVQPDNLSARQMLNTIDQERKATNELNAVGSTSAIKATGELKSLGATKSTAELRAANTASANKATGELKVLGASKATSEQKAVSDAPATSSVIRPIKANNVPQGHFLLYTTVAVALLIIAATIAAAITL